MNRGKKVPVQKAIAKEDIQNELIEGIKWVKVW